MDQRIPHNPGQARAEIFGELYAAHYRPLVAMCRRRVGSRDAEELAQEAFLRAWSSWETFASSRPFWPWVSTIANRLCIDRGRRVRTAEIRGPHAVDHMGAVLPTPEEAAVASEEYRWAREALQELNPEYRRVLQLREIEGWSYDRIASHEGVSVESVRGSLRRARTHLRLAYARMASSAPLVVLLVAVKGVRRRMAGLAHRLQNNAAFSGILTKGTSEAVAALVVIVMGTGGGLATGSGTATLASPAPRGGGVVNQVGSTTSTSAGKSATTSSTAGMRDGGSPPRVVPGRGRTAAAGGLAVPGTDWSIPVGDGNASPDSGSFEYFAASPNFANDREVFASGLSRRDCTLICPALFHSTDGGASWTRLQAIGFEGGTIMLPPSYPADHRIFVGGPNALKVSGDNGTSFVPLTPAGGYTAMSPAFSSGDSRILVGAIPGWIYHDDTRAVTPFDAVPQSTSVALSFSYAPAYPADHRIVIGGTDATPKNNATVSACVVSNCTPAFVLPGTTGTPAVMTSKTFSKTGLAFAWGPQYLYRSIDGAATFAQLTLPGPGQVRAIAEDSAGAVYLALWDSAAPATRGGLFVSHDAGVTWSRLGAGTLLDDGVLSVISLPNGNILASPYASSGGGLQCSSDGGRSWAPRCS